MGKSITNSIYDLMGAFNIAEMPGFLGAGRKWNAVNKQQRDFVPLMVDVMPFVQRLVDEKVLKAHISWKAAPVNDWFKKNGFKIELRQQANPDTFYVGSIYEQLVRWAFEGRRFPLKAANGQEYRDAVKMEMGVSFYEAKNTSEGIARIVTKNPNDFAYMVKLSKPSTEPFGLLKQAQEFEQQLEPSHSFGGLQFPMVHIDHSVSLDWLVNFWTQRDSGQKASVSEAKQQSILKINEKGALARSGAGVSMTLESMPMPPLVMDSQFLFWISRVGMPLPMFAACVHPDDWKNPGELK